ncbi:unnamed protein product [Sphagnum compactum]
MREEGLSGSTTSIQLLRGLGTVAEESGLRSGFFIPYKFRGCCSSSCYDDSGRLELGAAQEATLLLVKPNCRIYKTRRTEGAEIDLQESTLSDIRAAAIFGSVNLATVTDVRVIELL